MRRVYLDHTATTPLDPRVFEAMRPYFLEKFGNASSIHQFGQEARAALDNARSVLARAIGAKDSEVFFTGSGTEADNFAIKGVGWHQHIDGKNHIITSKAEHHAVLESCKYLGDQGWAVTYLDVDATGMVNPDDVGRAIRPTTKLISIMHANNEVGTINPILQIANVAKEYGVFFHTDAVQSLCRLSLDVENAGIDLAAFTAHKIYGPKGIGAIFIRRGVETERLLHGGGQERGRRASTEAIPLAVGFARAVELMQESSDVETERLSMLRATLRGKLEDKFPFLIFNGHPTECLPHILNVSFDSRKIDIRGDELLLNLDLAGVAVTSGSACTAGNIKPSHVLSAMGCEAKTAQATLRFSLGRGTTEEEIDYAVETLSEIVKRISKS